MNSMQKSQPSVRGRAFFLILPQVEIMDLAGPMQVFHEAGNYGYPYEPHFISTAGDVRCEQGLCLAQLEGFGEFEARAGDLIFIPGVPPERFDFDYLEREVDPALFEWLRMAAKKGARICSICTGAFYLAHAGLLDGKRCTTHWNRAEQLASTYAKVEVLGECLFVQAGHVYSSAGIASGIDLALAVLEELHGPLLAARVAQEMVVFMRRNGAQTQRSVFVDFRSHLNPGVHTVQDWLTQNLSASNSIEGLAELASMSSRNLTRVFKQATGLTIQAYTQCLRVAQAEIQLRDPNQTIEGVAASVGFADARQLRRIWQAEHGMTPADWRQQASGPR